MDTERGLDVARPLEPPATALADRRIAACGLIMATALQAADATIVNVALPHLQHDLGGGVELGAWVIAGYLCATAVMAPLTGMLRRRYGARNLFSAALGVFIAASALCGLAPSVPAIIASRLLQGAGGGVVHPLAQALLLDIYPKPQHARMLGIMGAGLMLGPILGPPLGGAITDLASWRWVFLINLPLGLCCILCVARLQPQTLDRRLDNAPDWLGVVLLMAGIAAFELLLQRSVGNLSTHAPEILGEGTIALASFGALAVRARHGGFAALRPEVFRDLNFAVAAFYNFTLSALLLVTILFVPLLVEGPLGLPASAAGAVITPRAVVLMLMMLVSGRAIGRVDDRVLLCCGWLLMAGGLLILSDARGPEGVSWILFGSIVQAVGAGLLYIPHANRAYLTLPEHLRTDASGMYSLLRQLGYASGAALMSAVLQTKIASLAVIPAGSLPASGDYGTARAYTECFWLMAVAALAILPGVFLFRNGPAERAARGLPPR